MKDRNYIEAKEFCDFKKNQDKLIKILNHSVSKISGNVEVLSCELNQLKNSTSKIEGMFGQTNKLMWWVLGILSAIFIAQSIH